MDQATTERYQATITQFVADFFSRFAKGATELSFDYDDLPGSPSWTELVSWVTQAGQLFEETLNALCYDESDVRDEWYDVLEAGTGACADFLKEFGWPADRARLIDAYRKIIRKQLEPDATATPNARPAHVVPPPPLDSSTPPLFRALYVIIDQAGKVVKIDLSKERHD